MNGQRITRDKLLNIERKAAGYLNEWTEYNQRQAVTYREKGSWLFE